MNNSIVSIIIPCYNQAQFLDETLHSVFDQSYTSWECLMIDDGSTDNTSQIAKQWCEKDDRFTYYRKQNGGLSSARNFGLKKATGDFIQFLDSDDLILPEKLEIQSKHLQMHDISICDYFPFDHVTGDYKTSRYLSPFLSASNYKQEVIIDWEYRKSIPCHAVLFKRSLLIDHTITFDESLPNHEDWVFWVQVFYASSTICNMELPLARYRIHNKSMSTDPLTMKNGFLKAAKQLELFFQKESDPIFLRLVRVKYREIYKKGRAPLAKKMFKRLSRRLSLYFRNA